MSWCDIHKCPDMACGCLDEDEDEDAWCEMCGDERPRERDEQLAEDWLDGADKDEGNMCDE